MVLKKVAAKRAAAAAAAAADNSLASSSSSSSTILAGPQIECRAQQSRFWTDTLTSGVEVDLKDVTVNIGERELLSNAHVRLKEGVRYGLIGRYVASPDWSRSTQCVSHNALCRNGTGKSTLFKALADKLIPGLNPSTRILMLSQVEDTVRAAEEDQTVSVLEHVIRGDKELVAAEQRHKGEFRQDCCLSLDPRPLTLSHFGCPDPEYSPYRRG